MPRRSLSTSIHVMALDGIVNVNSLFMLAVFLGLAGDPSDPKYTLTGGEPKCAAAKSVGEDLITFHVYSFSAFLFSSLVASGLKQAIRISRGGELRYVSLAQVNTRALRAGILASATGSLFGCIFLLLALVNLIQIKLGSWACRSFYSFAAVVPLFILVPSALIIYLCVVLHAFTR